MIMDSDPRVPLLAYLSRKITFYCPLIIIVIGNIGCFCNFITFSSRKLIKTSCSLYFLCAAVFDLFTLDFGALTRLLTDHFGYNAQNYSQAYCRTRQYLVNLTPAMATCFIVLAAMDRYLSTSPELRYRSFATVRYAKWIISFSSVTCILLYAHYFIFSDLRPACSLQAGAYSLFTVIYNIVVSSFIPYFLMLYFGFGTQHHVRAARRRVQPLNSQQRHKQRTEVQLVTMMLFQVGISTALSATRIAYYSYSVITINEEKTAYQRALDSFFAQLTTQLFYLNYAKSFYIYTLSSKYFRRIFLERITRICRPFFQIRMSDNMSRQ